MCVHYSELLTQTTTNTGRVHPQHITQTGLISVQRCLPGHGMYWQSTHNELSHALVTGLVKGLPPNNSIDRVCIWKETEQGSCKFERWVQWVPDVVNHGFQLDIIAFFILAFGLWQYLQEQVAPVEADLHADMHHGVMSGAITSLKNTIMFFLKCFQIPILFAVTMT